ncbi:Rho GTPase activating protein [Entomophthora muscae]|uniref:Rho GTPase activating protein n=1 Tax=Entomophthora muscae TaxID=34485 RepID=A0ACC2U7N2_9FUNG|nr:Rho GTPase activating protein [Entomophthora muscae]
MLRSKFDTEGDYGLVDSGVYYDVHAISGLLKLYLRELPSTVLTAELHRDFLQITGTPFSNALIFRTSFTSATSTQVRTTDLLPAD